MSGALAEGSAYLCTQTGAFLNFCRIEKGLSANSIAAYSADLARFVKFAGEVTDPPGVAEIREVLVGHLHDLYAFYGEQRGARVARKHIGWYTKGLKNSAVFRARMNTLETAELQLEAVQRFFDELLAHSPRLEYDEEVALAA